jgi:rare lipoprotein A (peptidoglycan hydrolase)
MRLTVAIKLLTAFISSLALQFPNHLVSLSHMRTSYASWYEDAGATASGRHYHFGFAALIFGNQWGKRVRFCYRHSCVTGRLDDHGPYVHGRTFDLNQNIAGALGFEGVHKVKWKVIRNG